MHWIAGTMTGSATNEEGTLSFSSLQQIRPMIETVPLANAAEAYGWMMRNEARFRIVLVIGPLLTTSRGWPDESVP
jgi:D-arabinose 1-dehydrogenase-like Zn-dependent alcohol dehydrogenase